MGPELAMKQASCQVNGGADLIVRAGCVFLVASARGVKPGVWLRCRGGRLRFDLKRVQYHCGADRLCQRYAGVHLPYLRLRHGARRQRRPARGVCQSHKRSALARVDSGEYGDSRNSTRRSREVADCVVGYAMGSRQVFDGYYGGYYGAGWVSAAIGAAGAAVGEVAAGAMTARGSRMKRVFPSTCSMRSRTNPSGMPAPVRTYELSGPDAVQKIDLATAAIFAKFPVGAPPVSGAKT